MSDLERERQALRQQVAQSVGEDARQPRVLIGQLRVVGLESDILALPVARSSEIPIQILDPADGFFGFFRFMAGVSQLDATKPDVLL